MSAIEVKRVTNPAAKLPWVASLKHRAGIARRYGKTADEARARLEQALDIR